MTLSWISRDENDGNEFSETTHEAVSLLEEQLEEAHGLEPTGEVDQATAKAINQLVYDRVSEQGERAIQMVNLETALAGQSCREPTQQLRHIIRWLASQRGHIDS